MNFNSQICTTKEQSERLLALGLKKETADMYYSYFRDRIGYTYDLIPKSAELGDRRSIPTWSLHRLLELCGIDRMPISFYKKGKVRIRVNHIHPTHDGRSGYNHYDSLIDCIEWLIKEGYFNKEYLERI